MGHQPAILDTQDSPAVVVEEVRPQVLAADEDARGIVADRILGEELDQVLPQAKLKVVAVGPLEPLDGPDVLGPLDIAEKLVDPRPQCVGGRRGALSRDDRQTARNRQGRGLGPQEPSPVDPGGSGAGVRRLRLRRHALPLVTAAYAKPST